MRRFQFFAVLLACMAASTAGAQGANEAVKIIVPLLQAALRIRSRGLFLRHWAYSLARRYSLTTAVVRAALWVAMSLQRRRQMA